MIAETPAILLACLHHIGSEKCDPMRFSGAYIVCPEAKKITMHRVLMTHTFRMQLLTQLITK
jgi:hypothetical protein